MTQTDELLLDRPEPALAVLTINRPQRLNALAGGTAMALSRMLDHLAVDHALRVLVITGAGRGFCSGWDLGSGSATGDADIPGVVIGQELFSGLVRKLRSLDKIVIAAVNGPAVGAGMGIALGADLRMAASSATFHVGAIRIGLTAGECGISYHLPRIVGAARAFELMLTGRALGAEEAQQIGLVSHVVDDASLLPQALALAGDVLRNSPFATRHTKRLMWANLDAPSLEVAIELENHAQVLALQTADCKEAVRAFSQKRAPKFQDR